MYLVSNQYHLPIFLFSMLNLKLVGYNGRGPSQCSPQYLEVLQALCPKIETMHLCMTFPETFFPLSRFR